MLESYSGKNLRKDIDKKGHSMSTAHTYKSSSKKLFKNSYIFQANKQIIPLGFTNKNWHFN